MKFFSETIKLKSIYIGLYYLALLLILSSWTDTKTSPNFLFKVVYFLCLLLPALCKRPDFVPMLVVSFASIGLYGYAYSFMPTYLPVYLGGLFLFYLAYSKGKIQTYKTPTLLVVFGIFTIIMDLVTASSIENISYSIFIIILLCKFINNTVDRATVSKFSFAFSLMTLVLSLYFILLRDQFTQDYYAQGSGLERTGWMDPNYFGMVLGMGTVASIIQISSFRLLGFGEKIFYLATVVLSVPTLVLNASRGAILAVAVSFAFVIIFSKVKPIYKIIVLLITVLFLYYLYDNSYFDLLEYRIDHDSGTGSGRTTIWHKKMEAFWNGEPYTWLVGYGNVGGKELAFANHAFGSHNDYIAILCAYGLIGLTMFIGLLLYPILNLSEKSTNKAIVLSVSVYIIMMCTTLEPYTAGRFPYFCFYLYSLLIMSASNNQKL